MREYGSGTRELFENYLWKKGVSIHIKEESPFPEAMKNALFYNGCLAAISVHLLKQEIKEGSVHIICNSSADWERSFSLVFHKDTYLTGPIDVLSGLLRTYQQLDFLDGVSCGTLSEC